jgi:hypothetical protein
MARFLIAALFGGVIVSIAAAPAMAADAGQKSAKTIAASPTVDGDASKTVDAPDGAFGFADDSGTTGVGRYQFTLDFLPSWSGGAMTGRDLAARAEINTGLLDTLQLGVAASGLNTRNTPRGAEIETARSYAFSVPGKWQWRAREVNDFGMAFLFEPFIGRQQNNPAPGGLIYGIDAKIAVDANIDNRFYATFNIGYAISATSPPVGGTDSSGLFYLSLAGSYRVTDGLYVGAQVRQGWQFAKAQPNTLDGDALALGPTIAWQLNDNLTFSAVYLRQIVGNDRARPASAFELTDFRQNDARVRMTLSF